MPCILPEYIRAISLILEMYSKWKKGSDFAAANIFPLPDGARRKQRKDI